MNMIFGLAILTVLAMLLHIGILIKINPNKQIKITSMLPNRPLLHISPLNSYARVFQKSVWSYYL